MAKRIQAKDLTPSCGLCDQPDTESMVQCDECNVWFHYECGNVSDDIVEHDWSCVKCVAKANTAHTSAASSSDRTQKHTPEVVGTGIEKKSKVASKCGSQKSKHKIEMDLLRLEEEQELKMLYLQKKYEIMQLQEESGESDSDEDTVRAFTTKGRTRVWVNAIGKGDDGTGTVVCASKAKKIETKADKARALSLSALCARQSVPAELPIFTGKAEEWPIFISSFENSTRVCGFTNDENLLRLQRALRGKALDYVGSKLMLPSLVPEIIATLRMVFGRPEHIIGAMINKLRMLPTVNANKLETLVNFALEVKNLSATMVATELHSHLNNPMLIQELIEKMPAPMKLNWAMFSRTAVNKDLSTFSDWLFDMAEAASSVLNISAYNSSPQEYERRKNQRISFHQTEDEGKEYKSSNDCCICKKAHQVSECPAFKKMSCGEKWKVVRSKRLCRTCLNNHNLNYCPERKECGIDECSAKHHPLLHQNDMQEVEKPTTVALTQNMNTSKVLYKIVPVTMYGKNSSIDVYAFLDDGSGPTLIDESILQSLKLQGQRKELCLKWTDGSVHIELESQEVNIGISARGDGKKRYMLQDVRSVKELDLPSQTLIVPELTKMFKHLRGLPIQSYRHEMPKVIIGLNNHHVAMPLKFREGKEKEPAATKTRLGWTIFGVVDCNLKASPAHLGTQFQLHVCECDDTVAIQKLMIQGMTIDEPAQESIEVNDVDYKGNKILQESVTRDGTKFVARLLWKSDGVELPDNFEMARRRLACFERKLKLNPGLKERVSDHIKSMEEKGYIKKLTIQEIQAEHPRKWYLPTFVVHNANKPEKIRLVWDAAATFKDVSLNHFLDKGPDLLTSLRQVLFNFRIGKIGICADISEMFHRITIHEDDVQSQRFLWRPSQSQPIDVYVLQVLSFGTNCSPSIAQYVKNRNAKDNEDQFPRAAKAIMRRHYVDDMLDSVNTVEEAIQLAKNVREIHKNGNFHIRNWLSNAPAVAQALGEKCLVEKFCTAAKSVDDVVEPEKVLGMWWQTESDVFTFNLKFTKASTEILSGDALPTKREVLRLLMSIFDPLGILAFFTINLKLLMQDIWRSAIAWDETIKTEHVNVWKNWMQNLCKVEDVKVPRCYFNLTTSDDCEIQLHVVVDASEQAYAAIAYLRITSQLGTEVSFVCARSKVAPLKPLSIPRMELLAAVIGARLGEDIERELELNITSTHFWSDSKTVLLWLRSDPRTFKPFVMYRVGLIQETTSIENWHYVPTKQNVADLATKYNRQPNFDPNSSWFTGPCFLRESSTNWPSLQISTGTDNTNEFRKVEHCAVHTQNEKRPIKVNRFSKWERLLRCVSYVLRFISNLKSAIREKRSPKKLSSLNEVPMLTSNELHSGQQLLYRLAQAEAFSQEITLLKHNPPRTLPKSSALRKLSPFFDNNNVLRMQSRVEKASVINDDTKYPVILPKGGYITRLIVDWYHRRLEHINHETVINEIFQKYHITSLRKVLRTIRLSCQHCKNRNAKPAPPEMSSLPVARLAAYARPFTYVGLDFFGPYNVCTGRRTEKRYGAIFTCLTCRAVHIEMAYSLSMNSCVIVIRNFIARRGTPRKFFSDNGTNLKASEKELKAAYKALDFGGLEKEFTTPELSWSFLPPASPHMGGCWERMVRSIKAVLNQIVSPETKLTDEKLQNLLTEIESIINRRPLTYLSLETGDQEALTPNHFLLGSTSGEKPPGKFEITDRYVKSSWRHSQLLADMFWKRWVNEVLPTLTRRTTWFDKVKPIEVGQIVIIVDPNAPRNCWPKGIVTSTVTSEDGQVRSAIVRTKSGVYHRPAAKLAVLDVNQEESDIAT